MGVQAEPARLLYDFRLDDHVADNHILRGIDRYLDLGSLRAELKRVYSSIGRLSIYPELMIRMAFLAERSPSSC